MADRQRTFQPPFHGQDWKTRYILHNAVIGSAEKRSQCFPFLYVQPSLRQKYSSFKEEHVTVSQSPAAWSDDLKPDSSRHRVE